MTQTREKMSQSQQNEVYFCPRKLNILFLFSILPFNLLVCDVVFEFRCVVWLCLSVCIRLICNVFLVLSRDLYVFLLRLLCLKCVF